MLCLKSSHTTASCSYDSLTVYWIADITGSKETARSPEFQEMEDLLFGN